MFEIHFGGGVCSKSYAFLTYLNNRRRPPLKRSRGHVLDLQRYLKACNSCPLSHPIFTKQLLNSPNNSLLQLHIFFSYLARYLLLRFPNVLLTHTSARTAASALNQGGLFSLVWERANGSLQVKNTFSLYFYLFLYAPKQKEKNPWTFPTRPAYLCKQSGFFPRC